MATSCTKITPTTLYYINFSTNKWFDVKKKMVHKSFYTGCPPIRYTDNAWRQVIENILLESFFYIKKNQKCVLFDIEGVTVKLQNKCI